MHGQPPPSRVTTDWNTLEGCQPISELTEDPADHHHPPILYPFGILAAGPRNHHHHLHRFCSALTVFRISPRLYNRISKSVYIIRCLRQGHQASEEWKPSQ
ncbi:hypothetical protein ASPFODRAFT_544047 [Aspergillus luchuensis CBS 106.47]|uniref:Uncharacterized protein n=1 Tax=Aspergillus luchuensis (strain CBS 106.47) TaxID=1137211 RepID=A0A1M3TNS4_ASPLC|nr:hypothetical protein ASPFODRAFT_544047 [Aspergillus luchuensis CBS 106.47]